MPVFRNPNSHELDRITDNVLYAIQVSEQIPSERLRHPFRRVPPLLAHLRHHRGHHALEQRFLQGSHNGVQLIPQQHDTVHS